MSTLAVVEEKQTDPEHVLWEELEAAAVKYRVLSATTRTVKVEEKAPEKKIVEKQAVRRLVFAGLRVKLSEVLAEIAAQARATPPNGISSLVIYADTLVLDTEAEIAAHNVVLMARLIDAKPLGSSPITLRVLTQLHDFVLEETTGEDGKPALVEKPGNKLKQSVQILAGSIDGTLRLAAKKDTTLLDGRWAPKSGLPLGIEFCRLGEDGRLDSERKSTARELADLVKRPLALSAFKAAFAAAGYLARVDEEKKTQQAVDMLRWVEVCLRSAGAAANEDELLFEELADQVSSLLIPLEVTGNAFFVPTLSAEFYRAQMDQLLDALESYEGQLRDLEIRTDIGKSLEAVSGGMRHAAQMEIRPLKTELSMVRENMLVLEQSIMELNHSFSVQSTECRKLYDKLDVAIRDVMDKNLIMEGLKLATDGLSFLFSFQKT
ncbi:MAG: hypothetical protein JF584_12145, partial [Acidobacteria bacterium]|nr:hypothetical protein [Acidobacteriota bacterium]